jgi:hypothetical protein
MIGIGTITRVKMARSKDHYVEVDGLDPRAAALRATPIWALLAFDDEAKAALKRDGLMLEALRLTGPMPFVFSQGEASQIRVTAPGKADADDLLDLFRVWMLPRLRAAAAGDEAG